MSDKNKKDEEGGPDDLDKYARQIWLAGLGAYTRLGKEGSKLFDALISEGKDAEKTASRGSLDRARHKVEKARKKLGAKFGDWETLFDKRLQGATERIGLASQAELQALTARVEALTSAVEALSAAPATAAKATSAAKPAARQSPTKSKAAPGSAAAVKNKASGTVSAGKTKAGSNTKSAGTAEVKTAPRRRSTAPKAATRGKTSPSPATDAAPGTPPEL